MSGRKEVTPQSVRAYLDRYMDGRTYHLFYGLHLLSRDIYVSVMDALINGDLQPEELVRFGGFSDQEVTDVMRELIGNWVSPVVASPVVGLDGYIYLTRTLGLSRLLSPTSTDTEQGSRPTGSRLNASCIAIGKRGHANANEVHALFRDLVLDGALQGSTEEAYLPVNAAAYGLLPMANTDSERQAILSKLCSRLFTSLMDDRTTLTKLIQVGLNRSSLQTTPSLATWIMSGPTPVDTLRMFLQREAGERTVKGAYTRADIEGMLDILMSAEPEFVGVSNTMIRLKLMVDIVNASIAEHFPNDTVLNHRAQVVTDVYQALFSHRERLRLFIERVLEGCMNNLLGTYPSS